MFKATIYDVNQLSFRDLVWTKTHFIHYGVVYADIGPLRTHFSDIMLATFKPPASRYKLHILLRVYASVGLSTKERWKSLYDIAYEIAPRVAIVFSNPLEGPLQLPAPPSLHHHQPIRPNYLHLHPPPPPPPR